MFVDANGKRTREDDLKWTGLPLSFGKNAQFGLINKCSGEN